MKSPVFFLQQACMLFILVLFSNCNNTGEREQGVNKITNKADTLFLPDSMVVYSPFHKGKLDSAQIANSALKVYSFVDVSCPSCLTNIKNWNKFASTLKEYNVPVILICQSEDNYELLKHLCENKRISEFPFPFYFDVKKQFFALNKLLSPSPNQHTVLTDKNNRILMSGDLTLTETTRKAYLDTIKNLSLKR